MTKFFRTFTVLTLISTSASAMPDVRAVRVESVARSNQQILSKLIKAGTDCCDVENKKHCKESIAGLSYLDIQTETAPMGNMLPISMSETRKGLKVKVLLQSEAGIQHATREIAYDGSLQWINGEGRRSKIINEMNQFPLARGPFHEGNGCKIQNLIPEWKKSVEEMKYTNTIAPEQIIEGTRSDGGIKP